MCNFYVARLWCHSERNELANEVEESGSAHEMSKSKHQTLKNATRFLDFTAFVPHFVSLGMTRAACLKSCHRLRIRFFGFG